MGEKLKGDDRQAEDDRLAEAVFVFANTVGCGAVQEDVEVGTDLSFVTGHLSLVKDEEGSIFSLTSNK